MMPAGSLWFQDIKAAGRTAPAAAANTEFTDHHRNAHDQQEKKIDEDKCGTAKLAAEIGKFPDIPDAMAHPADTRMKPMRVAKESIGLLLSFMLDTCFLYKEWNQRGFIGLIGVGGAA